MNDTKDTRDGWSKLYATITTSATQALDFLAQDLRVLETFASDNEWEDLRCVVIPLRHKLCHMKNALKHSNKKLGGLLNDNVQPSALCEGNRADDARVAQSSDI